MSDRRGPDGRRPLDPRPLNLRGWIVRNLGEANEADELQLEPPSRRRRAKAWPSRSRERDCSTWRRAAC